jgi:hypothetical protein
MRAPFSTSYRCEQLLEPLVRTLHVLTATAEHAASSSSNNTSSSAQGGARAHLYEPLIYYAGALKNVSCDAHNQRALVKTGALGVVCATLLAMTRHVASATAAAMGVAKGASGGAGSSSSAAGEGPGVSSRCEASGVASGALTGPAQVAVQLTAVLRNLAVLPQHAPAFLAAGALASLKAALQTLGHHRDVALNLGRVLAKLSLDGSVQVCSHSNS